MSPGSMFAKVACWTYSIALLAWAALHFACGHRLALLLVVDPFAVYLFAPLPLALLVAHRLRSRRLLVCGGLSILVALRLWHGFGVTRLARPADDRPSLRIETFNVLGLQNDTQATIRTLLAEDADVVLIQELNPRLAAELHRCLGRRYPYRVLDPRPGTWGLGAISKYPLHAKNRSLRGTWGGKPQVLTLDWEHRSITLINFHMLNPPGKWSLDLAARRARDQQEAAAALVDFVREEVRSHPVIAAGDLNATDLSRTYATVTAALEDSWREAGLGLGNTFPGSAGKGSARLRLAG